jgi:hypothetical protein
MSENKPAPVAAPRPAGSLLDLICSQLALINFITSGVFALAAILVFFIGRRSTGPTWPYVAAFVVISFADTFTGIILALSANSPTADPQRVQQRQRLALLVKVGLLGLCITGLGVMLPFAYSNIFGAPLSAWRKDFGVVLLVAAVQLIGVGILVMGLQLARGFSHRYPDLRRLALGYNSVVAFILLVDILLIANLLPYVQFEPFLSLNRRYDWTASRLFSLEGESKKVLAGLNEPVRVYLMMPENDVVTRDFEKLLNNCRAITPNISWEVVSKQRRAQDYNKLKEQYRFPDDGVLVVTGSPPSEASEYVAYDTLREPAAEGKYTFKGESILINALNYLSEGKSNVIAYFTQGHGEPPLGPQRAGRPAAIEGRQFQALSDKLSQKHYQLRPLELDDTARYQITDKVLASLRAGGMPDAVATKLDSLKGKGPDSSEAFLKAVGEKLDKDELARWQAMLLDQATYDPIPADASLVVVAGPQAPLEGPAINALRAYVNGKRGRNGRLLILLPPAATPTGVPIVTKLERFVAEFNVEVGNDRVLTLLGRDPTVVAVQPNSSTRNPIARAFLQSEQVEVRVGGRVQRMDTLSDATFFSFKDARSVSAAPNMGRPRPGGPNAEELLIAFSDFMWAETNLKADPVALVRRLRSMTPEARRDWIQSHDPKTFGPQSVAVAVSTGQSSLPQIPEHMGLPPTQTTPRMIVIGNTYWLTDAGLRISEGDSSVDLFTSCVSWLREKPSIGASATAKERQVFTLKVAREDMGRLLFLPIGLALLGVIMLGGAVAIVRRR